MVEAADCGVFGFLREMSGRSPIRMDVQGDSGWHLRLRFSNFHGRRLSSRFMVYDVCFSGPWSYRQQPPLSPTPAPKPCGYEPVSL